MTLFRIAATLPLLLSVPVMAQDGSGYASTQTREAAPFVAADFKVPTLVEGPGFKLVPLGPDLVRIDFDAYMSSI